MLAFKVCLRLAGELLTVNAANPTGTPTEEQLERASLGLLNQICRMSDFYKLIRGDLLAGRELPYAAELE